jgi:hypothetical protein
MDDPLDDVAVKHRTPQAIDSVSQSHRYIDRIAGVRNGNAAVDGTRIGVHDPE